MSQNCEHLERCGFFKKWSAAKNLACQGFINTFCKGEKKIECKRLEHRMKTGAPPTDDMMPNGLFIRT